MITTTFKRFVLLMVLAHSAQQGLACDVCGCGAGGVFLGMMPQYKKYFSGVRWQYRKYNSHLGSATGLLLTQETFHTAEWYGGMRLGSKTQVIAFVPYQWHRQQRINEKVAIQGVGDISILGTTQIWENILATEKNKVIVHSLHAGAGIKVPTGQWQFANEGALGQHANFMLGTGSVDAIVLTMYQYNNGNTGVAASAMYRMNTTNKNEHKFGNRAQVAAQGFYKISLTDKQKLTPNGGILIETFGKDKAGRLQVQQSGGWAANAMLGCEYTLSTIATGVVWQPPIAQQMSHGEVKNTNRGMLYVTIVF